MSRLDIADRSGTANAPAIGVPVRESATRAFHWPQQAAIAGAPLTSFFRRSAAIDLHAILGASIALISDPSRRGQENRAHGSLGESEALHGQCGNVRSPKKAAC